MSIRRESLSQQGKRITKGYAIKKMKKLWIRVLNVKSNSITTK
jgi:hypothetical protein